MNARILELIKNHEIIQNQDLDLLNSEIKQHPYLQNIRAIHLFGTHKFDTENYQKELSLTAAYTTDKKILYQLINKKTDVISAPDHTEKPPVETRSVEELPEPKIYNEVIIVEKPTAKPVFVEGNLNRILFEGEEDFLERENEKIDIQSTLESGKIVTQSIIKEEEKNISNPIDKPEFTEMADAESFTPETIINELAISKEKPVVEDLSTISFHGLEEFLPDVKIKSNNTEENYVAPKPQLSKQDLEMQRLIAEVEAKVKASKKDKVLEIEPVHNHDLNFSENQKLEVAPVKNEIAPEKLLEVILETKTQNEEISEEKPSVKEEIKEKRVAIEKSAWKPMQFSGNTPYSLIDKKPEVKTEEQSVIIKNSIDDKELSEPKIEFKQLEERPVLNVSFLTQKVSPIESPKLEKAEEAIQKVEETEPITESSNVTNFINTWQTWLKIDREEEIIEEKSVISKVEVKNTVIEKFIEKEPKISKLKEESDFVVKEKGTNISHLMTETLANLYVDQKLYAKAIKAYETLATKHPHKEDLFKEKIQEIKELRKNP
ncbi:hypothetical protein [Kaistella jeonii]|uniref:Tetratricopeptide repeat protein n=1 Tax=Kaistella jeonii TaxID=266749 RepID=A0A0C1FMW9_9FLAO|nr:hypothetical protein [Kaistella jeonii]KIA89289.1 hypothetical protein OA86_06725 [Kaistella jeonii]SFC01981.1 hypothetical protein SAMN05421876_10566 [Kaistella jeonii]VEI96600.1 Uncharacterised protein [Kaistella jeonii]